MARRDFSLPRGDERTWIVGHTGSGKSHAGYWLLSHADYDRRPWVIVDYKRERLFRQIPRLQDIPLAAAAPKAPGVYRVRYSPGDEAALEELFERIWRCGRVGVLIDEGHALPGGGGNRSNVVRALASQGRSLGIPMIVISQRPALISTFVRSEADHVMLFRLNSRDDYKAMAEIMPVDVANLAETALGEDRHSLWFRARDRAVFALPPVPDAAAIRERYEERVPEGFWADLPRGPRQR